MAFFHAPPTLRAGIDLGGTKIEGILISSEGKELARRRMPTPQRDYPATVAAITALLTSLERDAGAQARTLGIGIPGAVSNATGRIKNANSTWLIGEDLEADLRTALNRPVRLENDANCFAVSEAADGAAAGAAVVFGVILGTGVGGGIAIKGQALRGVNAIAGEWGHNPLPWPRDDERPGPRCYCGQRGCLETFLSGPGFARDFGQADRTASEIEALAAAGDNIAATALARYQDRLARGLAQVINVLDPEIIVLGGGVSNLTTLYDEVPKRWDEWIFSNTPAETRLVKNRHGDSSGVRGAAWLWSADEAAGVS